MKSSIQIALATLIFLVGGFASASATKSHAGTSHTIPVIVKVDNKGVVTDVEPAYEVRPSFKHLLKDTLSKMITKPAMKEGKPVDSQFVITLAVMTTTGADNKQLTSFKYLTAKPLPSGSWTWTRDSQGHLALTSHTSQGTMNFPVPQFEKLNQANQMQRMQSSSGGSSGH